MIILNGHAAAGSFKQAFHKPSEEMLVSSDVLSCGPLAEYTQMDDWKSLRQNFWVSHVDLSQDELYHFEHFPRDFYHHHRELIKAPKTQLWIGTGLSDQLLLAFTINLYTELELDLATLEVVQFEKTDEKVFEIQALGLLSPEQLKKHPEPFTLNQEQISVALRAWQAVCNSNPEALLTFLGSNPKNLPFLGRAIQSLLYRYPDSNNGLSIWDEKLLRYTLKHGPNTARIVGYTLGNCLDGLDLVGDSYLFKRLLNMASPSLNAPLLSTNTLDAPMRDTKTSITEHGKLAIENKINVVEFNGLDDWVGGVHLDSSQGTVWLRKDNSLMQKTLSTS